MKTVVAILSLLTFLTVACATSGPQGQSAQAANVPSAPQGAEKEPTLAEVTLIEFQPYSDKSDAIALHATGPLPSLCVKLGAVSREREGNTIFVTLPMEPDPKAFCGDGSPVEFTHVIPIAGLEPGTYTVIVNGLSAEFTLGGG